MNYTHHAFSEKSAKFHQISLKQIKEDFVFKKLLESWGVLGRVSATNGCFNTENRKK